MAKQMMYDLFKTPASPEEVAQQKLFDKANVIMDFFNTPHGKPGIRKSSGPVSTLPRNSHVE